MKLKLDPNRQYAVALEGGGARGAYQVGVWKALDEAGICYNTVAGSSVGALNGAMMTMRALEKAEMLWENIRFSNVMNVDDNMMKSLFGGQLSEIDFRELMRGAINVLKGGGFDITPLRELLSEEVDEQRIRESDVEFFITTFSITDRRELYLRAKDIEPGTMQDMLLASAYFPAFRNERLSGKRYIDGGVQDVLPIYPLIQSGCKDIIAIRVYGFGIEKRVEIPDDVTVTTIAPTTKLGAVLNFDSELSRQQLKLGYFDGQRALYGLKGKTYYIDATFTEAQAYQGLMELVNALRLYREAPQDLRDMNERVLPRIARRLGVSGGYDALLIACLEALADKAELDPFEIMTDAELMRRVCAAMSPENAAGMIRI